jgi:hypothetical protein
MSLTYVILRHEGIDDPHFDLLFETSPSDPLTTWRSPAWPITGPTDLLKLSDHRREYLEYEGPVGGDRGYVKRVARGEYGPWVCEDTRWLIAFEDRSELEIVHVHSDTWRATPLPGR